MDLCAYILYDRGESLSVGLRTKRGLHGRTEAVALLYWHYIKHKKKAKKKVTPDSCKQCKQCKRPLESRFWPMYNSNLSHHIPPRVLKGPHTHASVPTQEPQKNRQPAWYICEFV